jgi:hypothetical protein
MHIANRCKPRKIANGAKLQWNVRPDEGQYTPKASGVRANGSPGDSQYGQSDPTR